MRRRGWIVVGVLMCAVALTPVYALTATNGFTLDPGVPLLTNEDLESLPEWSGFDRAFLHGFPNGSTVGNDALGVDSTGRIYAIAVGETPTDEVRYDGVVRVDSDGTNLETVVQWENTWVGSDAEGWTQYGWIRAIAVTDVYVPSTGSLEERLIVVTETYDMVLDGMVKEVMAYELDAGMNGMFDGELLFDWLSSSRVNVHLATDANTGDLFLLEATYDSRTTYDGSIRRFAWSSADSAYVEESAVTSNDTAFTDLVYLNGSLYTFDSDSRINSRGSDTILEVDPTGYDDYADYAFLKDASNSPPNAYYAWAATDGALYAAAYTYKKTRQGFISAVSDGTSVSASNAIATFGRDRLYAMAGASDGSMVALVGDGIYRLAPSTDGGDTGGGDTGGGGGKGGGKGKNK